MVAASIVVCICHMSDRACAAEFANLDFDAGDTSLAPIQVYPDGSALGRRTIWLPSWRVFRGERQEEGDGIFLNWNLATVDVHTLYDDQFIWGLPVEDKLAFAATQAQAFEGRFRTSLVQVGDIPEDAKSIRYQSHGGYWEIRVNGMTLDLYGWDPNFTGLRFQEVSADVSAWAGQEVELRFTQALDFQWNAIDSIGFSPIPVIPEPGPMSLVLLGAGALWWLLRRGGVDSRQ